MYEMFVLGELLEQSLHGYALHKIVQHAVGPIRTLSWGALYPLLRRLERERLIEREPGDTGGRERKRYRVTAAGEKRFQDLMAEPGAYDADYPDLITLKLANFHLVSGEERLAILRHYRGYVQFILDSLRATAQHVASEPAITEVERGSILRGLDRRRHVMEADRDWVDAEIVRVADELRGGAE